jgi:DNA-binding GntR family transcriptional regulator
VSEAPSRSVGLPPLRLQLSEEVADRLREEVMAGVLRPGDFIRLDAVAQRFGVSVTPVREALLLLRGEDVVRLIPRRGFVVAPLSRVDVQDLFELQAQLAGELAARAVSRLSAADIALLVDINKALQEAVAEQATERIESLEYQFHRTINIAADSRKLGYVLRSATQYLPRRFFTADAHWRRAVNKDHRSILVALQAGDAEQARQAVQAHVLDGQKRLVAHLDEVGFWTPAPTPVRAVDT